MPSLSIPAPLGAWQFLALALFVAAAAAGSVYLARKHRESDGGLPDAVFWDGFAGLAIVAPAVLLPALASPQAGLMLLAVAALAAAGSYRWTPAVLGLQRSRRAAREAAATAAAAAERHRVALARWQRYELDPGLCIDFPAMSDAGRPETAAMLKAMRAADRLGSGVHGNSEVAESYSTAVERLEHALAEAERAAGAFHISTEGAQ